MNDYFANAGFPPFVVSFRDSVVEQLLCLTFQTPLVLYCHDTHTTLL